MKRRGRGKGGEGVRVGPLKRQACIRHWLPVAVLVVCMGGDSGEWDASPSIIGVGGRQ